MNLEFYDNYTSFKEQSLTNFFTLSEVDSQTWFLIHSLALHHKTYFLHKIFIILSNHFICPKCRNHLKEFLENCSNKFPLTFEETISFHNKVNERIGKNNFNQITELKNFLLFGESSLYLFPNKNHQLNLTGFVYNFLLIYFYFEKDDRKFFFNHVIYEIFPLNNIPQNIIIIFSSNEKFKEIFFKLCDLNILNKTIFNKKNYKKILFEIGNLDFKPIKIDF